MFLFTLKSILTIPKPSIFRRTTFILNNKAYFSTENDSHFDIIISGGGLVGTTLACTLGKNPLLCDKRILLLEAGKEKPWTLSDKYSNRVVSINPNTHKLLNDIGAWNFIDQNRYAPVKKLQAWDAISDASITFGDETSLENISYIVENDLLLAAVAKELKQLDTVCVRYGAKIKDYHLPFYDENISKVFMDDGSSYTCDLLLGCDGFSSPVRKAMKVNYLTWNYDQMGVVATLKLSEEFDNIIAWQRFLPTGPIAFLPLTSSLSSLVWSTTPEHARQLLAMPEEQFVDEINSAICKNYETSNIIAKGTQTLDSILRALNFGAEAVNRMPPKVKEIEGGSRAAFPLGFGHSVNYIGKGVVLVGDAAHRIHPLAGQGVNLGFGDVICLNKVLGDAVYSGDKLDSLEYLKEYETQRQKHNLPTMLAVEGLHRLYNTSFMPLVLIRSLGLQITHALTPLKRAVINQAAT